MSQVYVLVNGASACLRRSMAVVGARTTSNFVIAARGEPLLGWFLVVGGSYFSTPPNAAPVIKAATSLDVGLNVFDSPLIIPQLAGAAAVIGFSILMGRSVLRRLGSRIAPELPYFEHDGLDADDESFKRLKLFWINSVLTLLVIIPLVVGLIALVFLFIIGAELALVINYPNLEIQRDLLSRHAPNLIPVTSLILAAGVFTGG